MYSRSPFKHCWLYDTLTEQDSIVSTQPEILVTYNDPGGLTPCAFLLNGTAIPPNV